MTVTQADVSALWDELCSRVKTGDRFAGLFATRPEGGGLVPVRARGDGGRHRHTRRAADAAGLAVATARFALHKEQVLRLVSALCDSRFGRGVVVPGGVRRSRSADRRGLGASYALALGAVVSGSLNHE